MTPSIHFITIIAVVQGIALGVFSDKLPSEVASKIIALGLYAIYGTFIYSIANAMKLWSYKPLPGCAYTDYVMAGSTMSYRHGRQHNAIQWHTDMTENQTDTAGRLSYYSVPTKT